MRIRKNMLANYLAKCIISVLILLYGNIKSSQKQHYISLVAITWLNLVRQGEKQTFTCNSVFWKSCLKNFGNSALHHFSPHPSCMACPTPTNQNISRSLLPMQIYTQIKRWQTVQPACLPACLPAYRLMNENKKEYVGKLLSKIYHFYSYITVW